MNNKVCILDYGSGNVKSVYNILVNIGTDVIISNKKNDIENCSHIILPGVGAYGSAMKKIQEKLPINILENQIINKGKPFLGICVGMQVLGDFGYEFGKNKGLGWIPGECRKLISNNLPLPHVGWNNITIKNESSILNGIGNDLDFYFVHSYVFEPSLNEHIISKTNYGNDFCSIIKKNNIFGVQFHPEKSHFAGKNLISNFLNIS